MAWHNRAHRMTKLGHRVEDTPSQIWYDISVRCEGLHREVRWAEQSETLGSATTEEMTQDSDIDLLILQQDTKTPGANRYAYAKRSI